MVETMRSCSVASSRSSRGLSSSPGAEREGDDDRSGEAQSDCAREERPRPGRAEAGRARRGSNGATSSRAHAGETSWAAGGAVRMRWTPPRAAALAGRARPPPRPLALL